jgi:hypothetical protein
MCFGRTGSPLDYVKVKVNYTLEQAPKAHGGGGVIGIPLLFP